MSEVLLYSGGALSQGPTAGEAIARRLGLPYGAVRMLARSAEGERRECTASKVISPRVNWLILGS